MVYYLQINLKSLESLSLRLGAKFCETCVREIKLEIEYRVQSLRVSYEKVNNSDFVYEIYDRFPHFTVEKNENWRELK